MAKTFAKNVQPLPSWAAQAGRSSALGHGWRCFPLPACNLPCTLPGGDSSSSQILSQCSAAKTRAVKMCRRLEETAPSRAVRWVPPSVLISHQIAQEGTGEKCRKMYVSCVMIWVTGRLPSPQRLGIPWKSTMLLTPRESGILTQGKAGQLGSPPQRPGVKLKYTSRRVAKSWKLLPGWEKRGCFQQCKIGLGESYFGNLPHTAGMAGSPGQGLELGHAVSAPEQRQRQRILPRTAMGSTPSPPGSARGHRISKRTQLPDVSWREITAPESNQIKRYCWDEWQDEGRQSGCTFKAASAKC